MHVRIDRPAYGAGLREVDEVAVDDPEPSVRQRSLFGRIRGEVQNRRPYVLLAVSVNGGSMAPANRAGQCLMPRRTPRPEP